MNPPLTLIQHTFSFFLVAVSGDTEKTYLRRPRAGSKPSQHELPAFVEIPRYYEVEEEERRKLYAAESDFINPVDPTPLQDQTCQYVFNVPASESSGCIHYASRNEVHDSRLDDMQAKLDVQQTRLQLMEEMMTNFRAELQTLRSVDTPAADESQYDGEDDSLQESVSTISASDLLQQLQQKITMLEDKLHVVQSEKDELQELSSSLTNHLGEKQSEIDVLNQEARELRGNLSNVRNGLSEAVQVNSQLTEEKKTFIAKIGTLANAKRILTHRLVISQKENNQKDGYVRRCRGEKIRVMEARHECKVRTTTIYLYIPL